MVQFSSSDQGMFDQEGTSPSKDGRGLEEHSDTFSQLDEQTSGLYRTMMSFLDLPDQEESPMQTSDDSSMPAPDTGLTAGASRSSEDSGLNLDGNIQADTEKAVKFSKLRPELSQPRKIFPSPEAPPALEKPASVVQNEGSKEDDFPGLSCDSCVKPESASPHANGGTKDWHAGSSYKPAHSNVIRFSTLREELSSHQQGQPAFFRKEDSKYDYLNETRAEQNPGAGESVSLPMPRPQQLNENDEASLFGEADVFSAADRVLTPDRAEKEACEIYESVVSFLRDTFSDVSAGKLVSIDRATSIVLGVVNSSVTRDEWSQMVGKVTYSSDSKDFLLYHHANVTIFSICLGITLQLGKEELCRIGVIALLHDIGKMLIPDEILFKQGKPTPEEWKVLRQYPYESYKMLSALGPKYEVLAQCALQVNERIDGSGSPRGLKAEAIHGYAQMIGLVDVYEAMTSNRPYRPKLSHYDAVKEILKTRKSSFARNFITALLKTFSIFPLGSHVRLNSGVIGRIIEVNKELPLRPKIEVLYDAAGMLLAVPFIIDLATQSFLYIQAPIPENELPAAG